MLKCKINNKYCYTSEQTKTLRYTQFLENRYCFSPNNIIEFDYKDFENILKYLKSIKIKR